jgi:hypothetical protein
LNAFPLVTPQVQAAAPTGLGGNAAPAGFSTADLPIVDGSAPPPDGFPDGGAGSGSLSAADIKSRFFSDGPTDIYQILGAIDGRIGGLNTLIQTMSPPCLSQPPVAYPIQPFGQSVTLYAQCAELVGSSAPADPGFVQFGQKDGVVYYYSAVGAGWIAAVLTPVGAADAGAGPSAEDASAESSAQDASAGSGDQDASAGSGDQDASGADAMALGGDAGGASAAYVVQAWAGVGYLNATGCGAMNGYDDCSYGVIELRADPSTRAFELSVAGIGFGYCGAQIKSDGTAVYGIGSPDMASVCGPVADLCVAASDVTTPVSCSPALQSFVLPALGRVSSIGPNAGGPGVDAGSNAAWAPSEYPGGAANSITLDGTSSDSIHFGPTSPTAGVGTL